MKKVYTRLFLILLSLCFYNASHGQIVGGDVFLQGHWIEVGEDVMGAFGTCTSPATYHPHVCCGTAIAFTPGGNLDVVYDWGHDGWSVGSPQLMGDYTIPGYPQEGWGMQVGATEYRNWAGGGICTGSFSIPGGITSYSNSGGSIRSIWTGNIVGIHVVQETRVDTNASWVIVTTKMYNTTAAPITNVYYERTCDPDNTSFWSGTPTTENIIVHQNEDARHDVMVGSHGTTSTGTITYNTTNSYLSLLTKDCRAKCGVCPGLFPGVTPSALWSGTGVTLTALHDSNYADQGIWLVFNVGTLAALGSPGDSAVVSYAYSYNGPNGIDSAFPDPTCTILGTTAYPPLPYPGVVIDTYNACANPGVTSVPIDLGYAEDRVWTWSTWTWSPGTGLSATTGAHVTVTTTVLPQIITYTVTGTDPATCATRTMLITFITCNNVRANSPCLGDTLFLKRVGDSTGSTYSWTGPGGFTSTLQDPFIYPATYVDSGKFFVIRTVGSIHDTDSISVTVHHKPIVTATNNGPLCEGMVDTLQLQVNPGMVGMTYSWTGPGGYTASVWNPTITPFVDADTGDYTIIVRSPYGCLDTAKTRARIIPQPPPPVITDQNYCQGQPFVPFTISGTLPGSTIYWYPSAIGGVGTTIPTTIPTSVVGLYRVWATEKVGSCESQRGTDSVRVTTTPPAPAVTGLMQYCQFIGPFVPVTVVTTTLSDSIRWYTVATGGTWVFPEPVPNLNISGTDHYWVSLKDSGCEGPRTPVNIIVHPKPAKPTITPQWYCQFLSSAPIIATVDGTDPPEVLTYYGPGVTPGYLIAPTPNTSVAPDTIIYYVTETTTYGCVSDSAKDAVVIRYKPDPPVTKNTRYCQGDQNAKPLNTLVDSAWNADSLEWYYNTVALPPIPVPPTNVAPGFTTWWVSQWVNGCQSDSAAVKVEIVYKPVFSIAASSPWVCQYDSIQLAYNGPSLFEPFYTWTLPIGAKAVALTNIGDSLIIVRFDSANMNNYVYLHVSDDSGFCSSDTSIRIKVISQPTMDGYTKPDVCLGDTMLLALIDRSADAYNYKWYVDDDEISNSGVVSIITRGSSSAGPFKISWIDTGKHVIKITSSSIEGCKSEPVYDSVDVHQVPDAGFRLVTGKNNFCLEDSAQFTANTVNYNYMYMWTPTQYFNNENKPVIWGKLRDTKAIVMLTVTDPYGCYATQKMEIDPGSCCNLYFPNAFTPNVVGEPAARGDNVFKPYFTAGYHRFHQFRIVNRWGQTVFESENSSDAVWDGRFNGVPQEMGTYYYFIKFDCGGQTFEQKGDVTLIR